MGVASVSTQELDSVSSLISSDAIESTASSGSSFTKLGDTWEVVESKGDESPFLFHRIPEGFQTSWNLDSGETISTDYILEYSRRSYNITLRYNPVLQLCFISLRFNDFNGNGNAEPFEGRWNSRLNVRGSGKIK